MNRNVWIAVAIGVVVLGGAYYYKTTMSHEHPGKPMMQGPAAPGAEHPGKDMKHEAHEHPGGDMKQEQPAGDMKKEHPGGGM